jgi:hypothetical protein
MKRLSLFAVVFALAFTLAPKALIAQSVVFNFTQAPGNQAWGGNLATLFNVLSPVTVTDLGIYNGSGTNFVPLNSGSIEVGLYDITTSSQVGSTETFTPGTPYTQQGYALFQPIGPVTLAAGLYEIDAVGFNGNDPNGNSNGGPVIWNFNNLGGDLSWTGYSIYSSSPILGLTTTSNGGTADTIWGGLPHTYEAGSLIATVPEGGASLLYLLLAGGACFGAMFLVPRNRFANLASA